MARDPENTLVIETTKGTVVIELRPDLAPGHVERIKTLAVKNFTMAWFFTASLMASWRRPATRRGTGMGGSKYPD